MIDQDEVNQRLSDFICEKGLWSAFTDYLRQMGYTDSEIEELEDG